MAEGSTGGIADDVTTGADDGTAPAARRGRPGYDQETVLRRAVELFNRQGFDGTSMGDLAAELGFSKSAIYHHVPSKAYLLEQALNEALDGLSGAIHAAETEPGADAYTRLLHGVEGSVRVLVDHLPAVTLLLRLHGNSELELDALRRRRDLDARLTALVREAVAEGALRDDLPPDLISRLLFGMVNSLINWVRPGGHYTADELASAITELAFAGLAAR